MFPLFNFCKISLIEKASKKLHLIESTSAQKIFYIKYSYGYINAPILINICLCIGWLFRNSSKAMSSRSQIFFEIGDLRLFAYFKGKHLCWILFLIKLQAWRPANLLKRVSNTGFRRVKFAKFLRSFLQNTSGGYFWKGQYCIALCKT